MIAPRLPVASATIIINEIRKAETGNRSTRVGTRPEAELDTLLVSLACMVYERDSQFLLNSRIMLARSLRKSEQRLVAGVVRESFCRLVIRGQVDAQRLGIAPGESEL